MRMVIFGPGFTGHAIAARVRAAGWPADLIGRSDDPRRLLTGATHVVSTVPPQDGDDPILLNFGEILRSKALIYLSSTGVYGDTGGAWVGETAPLNGRRPDRIAADRAWQERGATVLRLPGIYGPGRSVLDRLQNCRAHLTRLPNQVFSRIHVDDVARAVTAAVDGPAGVYNIADDLPASQDDVVRFGAGLLDMADPPVIAVADMRPAQAAFYGENRRIAAGRAHRLLGWRPAYPDFRTGLRAVSAMSSPANASAPPPAASHVQR